MSEPSDWYRWHQPYADPTSDLSRRLRVIQRHIGAWLDARPDPSLTVVSACAGQGHDILGVLGARPDAARVRVELLEADPANADAARRAIRAARLENVTVHLADAGDTATYADLDRADLLLLVGVFGNIPAEQIRATVRAAPGLCAGGATVIWTRSRRPPDVTPDIRAWFAEAGFQERAFEAPADALYGVGVHQLAGPAGPRPAPGRLFRFTGGGTA